MVGLPVPVDQSLLAQTLNRQSRFTVVWSEPISEREADK
jgi:hypothetical protein